MLTFGFIIYILLLSFLGDSETGAIQLSNLTVLITIIYLFFIASNIFVVRAAWKMCKNKALTVFDKVSMVLGFVSVIAVCFISLHK